MALVPCTPERYETASRFEAPKGGDGLTGVRV